MDGGPLGREEVEGAGRRQATSTVRTLIPTFSLSLTNGVEGGRELSMLGYPFWDSIRWRLFEGFDIAAPRPSKPTVAFTMCFSI